MILQNKRLFILLSVIAMLLLIPLLAMQFTNEVDWKPFDFAIMGILLLSTGLSIKFVLRKVKSTKHRMLIGGVLLLTLLLIWAELAVGLFGTRFAGS